MSRTPQPSPATTPELGREEPCRPAPPFPLLLWVQFSPPAVGGSATRASRTSAHVTAAQPPNRTRGAGWQQHPIYRPQHLAVGSCLGHPGCPRRFPGLPEGRAGGHQKVLSHPWGVPVTRPFWGPLSLSLSLYPPLYLCFPPWAPLPGKSIVSLHLGFFLVFS